MADDDSKPAPDPGNSSPEHWTADLEPAEADELADRLRRELEGDV